MATVAEVMAQLETAGTEQDRRAYRPHGAREPLIGVAFGVLRPLARALGRDDALARDLWATGNTEARTLAGMVADPAAMNRAVVATGIGDDRSRSRAIEAARRIGPVEVDHGDTGCVTAAAEPYIEKAWTRKLERAGRATEKAGTSR